MNRAPIWREQMLGKRWRFMRFLFYMAWGAISK